MIWRNTYRYRIKGHPILKRDEHPICLLYHVKIGHDMPLRIPDKSGAAALRHILRIERVERPYPPGIGDIHHRRAGALKNLNVVGFIVRTEVRIVLGLGHSGGRAEPEHRARNQTHCEPVEESQNVFPRQDRHIG